MSKINLLLFREWVLAYDANVAAARAHNEASRVSATAYKALEDVQARFRKDGFPATPEGKLAIRLADGRTVVLNWSPTYFLADFVETIELQRPVIQGGSHDAG